MIRNALPVLTLLLCVLSYATSAQTTPFFKDMAPPDETVGCFGDIPAATTLTARITNANGGEEDVEITPDDALSDAGAPCDGGTLTRTWTATNANGDATTEMQTFTFGPAPVGDGPTIDPTGLPDDDVLVDCADVNTVGDPDSYDRWITDRRAAVAAAVRPGCAPIDGIVDNAPSAVSTENCTETVEVLFTVTDRCGATDDVTFIYRTEDNDAPVLVGIPFELLRIDCADDVPAVPTVTVEDCNTIDPPTPVITSTQRNDGSCSQYSYDITRIWTVTDACGSMTTERQVIEVRDDVAPDFDVPFAVLLDCTEDFTDPDVAGRPFNVTDNCTPIDELEITFTDEIISSAFCAQNFNVRRTWVVTDACDNSRVQVQEFRVRDRDAPTFVGPEDTEASCTEYLNTEITGVPTRVRDNCDNNPVATFTDEIVERTCSGQFVVERTWIVSDACQFESQPYVQTITVFDDQPPFFTEAPQDLILTCNNQLTQRQAFNRWVFSAAGARYGDGCGDSTTVTVTVTASGTDTFPQLPPLRCTEADGTIRRQLVDIRLTDECGNTTVTTVKYEQIDELDVNLFDCPESAVIPTDPGVCEARVALPPPTIQDQCVSGVPFRIIRQDTVPITSAATSEAELGNTPVDPIILNFELNQAQLPVNAQAPGKLEILLQNADAEGADEFFFVYGEDGTLLGTTERSNIQCENVLTVLELPFDRFNRYAVDNVVSIRLEPNIPAGESGSAAINNLCEDGSRVIGQLTQPVFRLTEIFYDVFINDEPARRIDPIDTVFVVLPVGQHQISYRATDCGGNTDDCSFSITVEDREPPVVTCPPDIEVLLPSDSCSAFLEIPLPLMVEDNCEPYTVSSVLLPREIDDRLFRFNLDPNLNTYQAQPLVLELNDVPRGLVDSVDIIVTYQGAFDNDRAFLDLVLPDGSVLASTPADGAGCNRPGTLRTRIAGARFMELTGADDRFVLTLRPRPVSVPPGQAGEGVVPCGGGVSANGQTDGVTNAFVSVTYRTLRPAFFTTGATQTPLSQTTNTAPVPRLTFAQGTTEFVYIVADPSGNRDSCSINVMVRDTTPPIALCRATTIFVDPSGLEPTVVDPLLIGTGSSDNCEIETYVLAPDTYACERIGETQEVTLTVTDPSGNASSCTTVVSIAALPPEPTASTTVCGGDTLLLRANPPTVAEPGQTIYTFRWFGPDGTQISTLENPVIPGVDGDDSGAYRVVIRGITGCEAEGIANIAIGQVPGPPTLTAPTAVCTGDEAALTVTTDYLGSNIRYEIYRGTPGNGRPVGESREASFTAPFANGTGQGDFYVIAFVNGCESPASNVVTVRTATRPEVEVVDREITTCEFSTVTLRARQTADVEYRWTGPNGFTQTGRNITLADLSPDDAGTYYLRGVRRGGCFSVPDSVVLTVGSAGEAPGLTGGGQVCPSDTLLLSATEQGASLYLFSGPDGQEIETEEPTLRVAPVTPAVVGNWTVRVQRGSCPSRASDPVNVSVGEGPTVTAVTVPDPVCSGNNVVLQGSSSVSNSSYRWRGPGGFTSNSVAPVLEDVDASMAGDYVLTVTSPNGCFSEETLTVDVMPGVAVAEIAVAEGRCLNGGETVAIVARLTDGSAGSDFTFFWEGPEGSSTNDTLLIPDASLASNGSYRVTVTNENGCTSPTFRAFLELDFAPAPPATPFTESGSTTVCSGEDLVLMTNDFGPSTSYLWRLPDGTTIPTTTSRLNLTGLTDTLSGPYTVRAVRNGCSSLPSEARMINVTAFPAITAAATGQACSGQPIRFTATDIAGATYSWRGPNNFSSSLPNPTIATADAAVHAGRYTVVAAVNGCVSDTAVVDIAVLPTPAVPVIQPIEGICLNDPDAVLELNINPNTATAGATYQWFISNGEVPVGEPTDSLSLRVEDFGLFAGGGTFDFTVRSIGSACTSNPSSPVSVRLDEIGQQVADAGPDTVICAGLFLLEAAPISAGSGRWTLVEGTGDIDIINPLSSTTAVSGMTEFGGPYRFAWTLSNGSCAGYASDTVRVAVTDGEAAVAGDDVIACIRDEVRLTATPAAMVGSGGRWSQALAQEILGVEIVEPTNAATEIRGLQPDNVYSFIWTVTSNCGIKSDVVLVNVSDPSPFAGQDTTVCNPDRATALNADPATIGSTGSWRSLNEQVIVVEPENPRSPVTNLLTGENAFIWEVDGGFCGPRSRDTVRVNYKAPAQPRDDVIDVAFQGSVTFDPSQNDVNPAGSVISFPDPPSFGTLTDNGDGTYTYQAPDNFIGEFEFDYQVTSDGCSVSFAAVVVVTGEEVACAPPNIITPNNDGVNDDFVIPCLLDRSRFPVSQVTIYNQWGDEVYSSPTPYENDWDGTYQGNPLPVATYFYIIDFGGQREKLTGHVRIER